MWRPPFLRPLNRKHVLAAAAAASLAVVATVAGLSGDGTARAQDKPAAAAPATGPATQPGERVGKLPFVEFSVDKRVVRVECEALAVNAPLEFFVCSAGTAEHEAVMRTRAKPSHVHTALLAIGLKPGQPLTFLEATKRWLPPQGPPLHVDVEFQKDGKTVRMPAYRWMRDIKTKKEPPAFTWIFAGSRVTQDGRYGADDTGYVATLVNFDYALIDVPNLASNSNDLLEWERNADLMPEKGTPVFLVIEPAGAAAGPNGGGTAPATGPAAAGAADGQTDEDRAARIDEEKVKRLVKEHTEAMRPRQQALREAAETHYRVILGLRQEQQRLINEADRIQRAIDQIEKDWADATTPRPAADAPVPAVPPVPAPTPAP